MPPDVKQPDTFYVTTPIYYVNDKPHLGHVYTTMVADVVARYHRLRGDDTFFLTGVDEHAAKVSEKAVEKGLTPQQWADQNAAAFKDVFARLDMTNDDFVRTSEERHKVKVREYVAALLKSGDVYPGEYEGWYDAGQEEYVPENKAKEYDYKSPVNGKPLIRKKEKNYFFRLTAYVEPLLEHFRANPTFVQPDARRNEIVNRIKEAQDVPISRTGSGGWGIPVPDDEEQTIYVWIDALFNYLSYIDTPERRKYWRAGPSIPGAAPEHERGAVHFIAKDILWFHASVWPAMLLALRKCPGYDWVNLPRQIYSHSYWVSESGEKMSKSLGNFLDPAAIDNYVREFGLDALRYFLATRGPLGTTDSTFSAELFAEVYNSDLANTFGNSCSRVTQMIGKYFEGIFQPHATSGDDFINEAKELFELHVQLIGNFPLGDRPIIEELGEIGLALVRGVDKFIEKTAPFKLAKNEAMLPVVGKILAHSLEGLRVASVFLWPLLPHACEAFWSRIGCDYAEQMKANHGRGDLTAWVKWGQLQPGTPIEKGEPLFPRYLPK
jgi:methionyl-tRNA synthetase